MRTSRVAVTLFAFFAQGACGHASSDATIAPPASDPPAVDTLPGPATLPPPAQGIQIVTPDVSVAPGEEKFMCFFTTLTNTESIGVKRYVSHIEHSHHMIMSYLETPLQPDGTLVPCGTSAAGSTGASVGGLVIPAYLAQSPDVDQPMPPGIGVKVDPNQQVQIQMHLINPSTAPVTARVTMNFETYAPGETFQHAAPYVTFNTKIAIPARGTQKVSGSCPVPAGVKFFAMGTHSHMYTSAARAFDGATLLVETLDWEHPSYAHWLDEPLTLSTGKLDYECEYQNPTDGVVRVGESASKNEMCMAVGFFYPADKSIVCIDSTVRP